MQLRYNDRSPMENHHLVRRTDMFMHLYTVKRMQTYDIND